jgi:hypothetical protein
MGAQAQASLIPLPRWARVLIISHDGASCRRSDGEGHGGFSASHGGEGRGGSSVSCRYSSGEGGRRAREGHGRSKAWWRSMEQGGQPGGAMERDQGGWPRSGTVKMLAVGSSAAVENAGLGNSRIRFHLFTVLPLILF